LCSPLFFYVKMTDRERAHIYIYTLVQPRVNRGSQTNVDQIITFFIGQNPRENLYWLVVQLISREERERAERKKNRSERPRARIAFFFFLRRQTHAFTQKLYARTCHQLVWSNRNSRYTNRNQNQNT
jgi:hypothetical protein